MRPPKEVKKTNPNKATVQVVVKVIERDTAESVESALDHALERLEVKALEALKETPTLAPQIVWIGCQWVEMVNASFAIFQADVRRRKK